MYSLTPFEALVLSVIVLGVATALGLAVFVAARRAQGTVATLVTCPVLGRTVSADLARDAWTLRFTAVRRCSALGGQVALCNQGCLEVGHPRVLAQA
ncbi:MAG TPA: hypothetical protein VNN07_01010 [Candidatus Tectomicrobia bacterium]|nr:hypothetical protein [Candidatus Tectomicrobia bacterium]